VGKVRSHGTSQFRAVDIIAVELCFRYHALMIARTGVVVKWARVSPKKRVSARK
jgi:predicted butyrate kinase (DUF1464 family)